MAAPGSGDQDDVRCETRRDEAMAADTPPLRLQAAHLRLWPSSLKQTCRGSYPRLRTCRGSYPRLQWFRTVPIRRFNFTFCAAKSFSLDSSGTRCPSEEDLSLARKFGKLLESW